MSRAAGPFRCRICGVESDAEPLSVREMMFETREPFAYRACTSCGCVQIDAYPPRLEEHYATRYYAHERTSLRWWGSGLGRWLRRRRAAWEMGRPDPVGLALTGLLGRRECYRWLRFAGIGRGDAILDVGCGGGALLSFLHEEGFERLAGVDPFAREADRSQEGFRIRRTLGEVEGTFDFVLLNHSLEHMPEQRRVFAGLRAVCGPRAVLCIRIPVVGRAFRTYGADWVQIDAPRHLYLHSRRSLEILAGDAGFRVEAVHFDSTAFQFWGSEQYRMDVPLLDRRGHAAGCDGALFDRRRMRAWAREAVRLNRSGEGDQATFFLRTV